MRGVRRTLGVIPVVFSVLVWAVLAGARVASAEPTPQEMAAAEALFTEAKALMAQHRYTEACPKLAESQRLDSGGGTLLTLALCHEGEGKTASAWAEHQAALTMALRDGNPDRERVARQHAAALEPRLSRLSVRVPPGLAALPGAQVLLDGVALGRPAWGASLPVDPGPHRIEARAPAKRSWSIAITVRAPAHRQEVAVPELADAPGLAAAALPPPAPRRRTLGWTTAGVGVAALAASGYLALRAVANHREAVRRCPSNPCGDAGGVALNDRAKQQGDWAGIIAVIGLGATAGGVYLLLAPPAPEPRLAMAPLLGDGVLGATLTWRP